jgi:hypothetical protein
VIAASHPQLNRKRAQTIPRESKKVVCALTYYVILFSLFTGMWIFAAPTSQKANAVSVKKIITYHLQFFDAQNTVKTVQ